VSDEREGAAGSENFENGADDAAIRRGQTAVVTRPLRPTGKRSRQLTEAREAEAEAEVTETKGGVTRNGVAAKPKAAKKPSRRSRNPITFVLTYLQQVIAELRKVIWPNRNQMVSYTSVVLVFLAFMVALIGVVDLGMAKLVLLVLG
jgi:preprotein translocase subunit SecE